MPNLPYDIVDEILTKMKRLEFEPVLNELMWYVKQRKNKMTYNPDWVSETFLNTSKCSLIIQFNNHKYNTYDLHYDGYWMWGRVNRRSWTHTFTYTENLTCYTCNILQRNYNKNELRVFIKSAFPKYKEQIKKLKMKAFSKMTKNELINLYLKLE